MKFITTRMHGMEDYLVGILLLAAPNIFGFAEHDTAATVARGVGVAILLLSLMTRYELGLVRTIPMKTHLVIDAMAALFLMASPWLFGFADDGSNVWAPHVAVGALILLSGMFSQTVPEFDEATEHRTSVRPGGRLGV